MKVIIDTNIMVSALLTTGGTSAQLLDAWTDQAITLVTSNAQLDELVDVTRRPSVRPLITPAVAGRFVNDLRKAAVVLDLLPTVDRSPDPADNFLLAMAERSDADYLVTGDKRDVLALGRHGRTQIITVRQMLTILGLG